MVTISLDDGLPSAIQNALPALNERGLPATFFLIQNSPYDTEFRREVWREALAHGHEIGAHGVNHLKAARMDAATALFEAGYSRRFLEEQLGCAVTSFAYPFTDYPEPVHAAAQRFFAQARAGRSARADKFMVPGDGADLYALPAFHVNEQSIENLGHWLNVAKARQAWFVLMFHGIGNPNDWDNVPADKFCAALDRIRESGIRVATLHDAAEACRCA